MDDTLKVYLQSIEESVAQYKNGQLETKEYLQSLEDIKIWLEEQCDADSHD